MGDTLLHYAVYKENMDLIDYLLSVKADVNKKNNVNDFNNTIIFEFRGAYLPWIWLNNVQKKLY